MWKSPDNSGMCSLPLLPESRQARAQPSASHPRGISRERLTSVRRPLGPPPPEHDAEDDDGDSLARYEKQHQYPGHIPARDRGTNHGRRFCGSCHNSKTRMTGSEGACGCWKEVESSCGVTYKKVWSPVLSSQWRGSPE